MRHKVGIIGCGQISRAYLKTLTSAGARDVEVAACADLRPEAAAERAQEFGVARAVTVAELLADQDIRLVANLTIPEAHHEVTRAALEAGKHVYTEKPLALTLAQARELHNLACSRGLMLSCAPDTLLGSGAQAARRMVEGGLIGQPVSAFAQVLMGHTLGPRYLRAAVGTWLDMAPYYIGALVHLLGPAVRVCGLGTRHPVAHPVAGAFVPEAHARAAAVIEFAAGPLALVGTQSYGPGYQPRLEIFGSRGTLACPDPNKFEGKFLLDGAPVEPPGGVTPFAGESLRGAGLIEMARALEAGRGCRLGADFSLHCAEILLGVRTSMETGAHVTLTTSCDKPALMLP